MSGTTSYRVSARLQIQGDAQRVLQQVARALTGLDAGIARTERNLRSLMRALNGLGGAGADVRRAAAAMSQLQAGSQGAGQAVRGTTQSVQAQARALDRTAISANNATAALRSLSSVSIQSGTHRIHVGQGGARGDRLGELAGLGMTGRALTGRVGESLVAGGAAQQAGTIMTASGVTPQERAAAEARAWEMTQTVRGSTMSDNMQLLGQLRTTFETMEQAMEFAPAMARISQTLAGVTGRDPGRSGSYAARFLDSIDAFVNPETQTIDPARGMRLAQMMENSIIMNQGTVTPEEFLNFAKQGRVAARRLDPEVMFGAMPAIIEGIGGQRTGTELSAMYRQIVNGTMTQRVADQMVRYNLLDRGDIDVRRGGSVVVRPGSVQGSDLFARNPIEWIQNVLLPRLQAGGATTQDQQFEAISTLFGTETARGFVAQLIASMPQIQRNTRLFQQMPENAGGIVSDQGWNTTLRNLQAGWTNLMTALGSAAMADAMSMMNRLAGGLNSLAAAAVAHPEAASIIVQVAAALGGLLIAGAAWAAGSLAMSGLAGLTGALGMGAGGLAAAMTAVGWTLVFGALVGGLMALVVALKEPAAWSAMFNGVIAGLTSLWDRLTNFLGITGRTAGPGEGGPDYNGVDPGSGMPNLVPVPPGGVPPRPSAPWVAPFGNPAGDIFPQSFQPAPPSSDGGGATPVVLMLDGREIGRGLLPHIGRAASGPIQSAARFDGRRAYSA